MCPTHTATTGRSARSLPAAPCCGQRWSRTRSIRAPAGPNPARS
jgi:hypothetical protein